MVETDKPLMQASCPNHCAKEDCEPSAFEAAIINVDRAGPDRAPHGCALACGTARSPLAARGMGRCEAARQAASAKRRGARANCSCRECEQIGRSGCLPRHTPPYFSHAPCSFVQSRAWPRSRPARAFVKTVLLMGARRSDFGLLKLRNDPLLRAPHFAKCKPPMKAKASRLLRSNLVAKTDKFE